MQYIVKGELGVLEWDLQLWADWLERSWTQDPGNTREKYGCNSAISETDPSLQLELISSLWGWVSQPRNSPQDTGPWATFLISSLAEEQQWVVILLSSPRTQIQSYGLSLFLKSIFLLWFHSFSIHVCLQHTKSDLSHLRLSPSPPFAFPLPKYMGHRINTFALAIFCSLWPQKETP